MTKQKRGEILMKNNIINLAEYKNKKSPNADTCFSEYPDEIKLKLIKGKLYEELDEYYRETMNLLDKFENEFASLRGTTYIINNSAVSKDVVYGYIEDVILAFIDNRNILSCDDERYSEIRNDIFKDVEEHYFKVK